VCVYVCVCVCVCVYVCVCMSVCVYIHTRMHTLGEAVQRRQAAADTKARGRELGGMAAYRGHMYIYVCVTS
jgi:hypothetical protein